MTNKEFEEGLVQLRRYGRICFAFYQGCLEAGFDQVQAFSLTQTFVMKPNTQVSGPDSNLPGDQND